MTNLKTPEDMRPDEVVGEEELVAADDTIIGRAFRWSVLVFVVLGGAIFGMVQMLKQTPVLAVVEPAPFVPPRSPDAPAVAKPVTFTAVTSEAGVDFVHYSGATGDKLLPETMGGGCAFLDFDNDGHQDLLLVNSCGWDVAGVTAPSENPSGTTHALYRNDGRGNFTNVTQGSGLDVTMYGMGAAVGDYDNDGDADVFITAVGANRLLRNDGSGRFTDVTSTAGVSGEADAWSTSAGFFDYDNDGDLDLMVCNYVQWSREIDFAVNYTLTGVGRAYGPPTNFQGTNSYLYRNNGDGTFAEVGEAAGMHVNSIEGRPMGKALGLVFVDVDRDGFMDAFVANDTVRRFFFHNRGDGTFVERGAEFGLAFDRAGNATGAMGVDAAWYRNDASLGFVIGNFANEMSSLLVSQDKPTQFSDESITEGLGAQTRLKLTFGACFFDYDLDGRQDLLHANGHIEDQINIVQSSQHYLQPAQVFWNAGPEARSCYVEVESTLLGDLARPMVGRGAACADIDSDGDLDVMLTQTGGPPRLLRNDLEGGAAGDGSPRPHPNWVRLKLVGNGSTVNRDAIGARIALTANGITQVQQVMPTRSYLSQIELPLTFGLGETNEIERVRIIWPDGTTQDLQSLTPNEMHTVQQGE